MSLSFDGGSDSPIERERRGFWEQSVRRRLRLLKAVKVSLEIIVAVWAMYNTIRYFLAYTMYSSMAGQQTALALGTSTAICIGFLACAAVVSALHPFLIAKRIPIRALLVTRTLFRYLGSFFLLSPAIVNLALTIVWRHSSDTELDPDRRCHLDVDIIWSTTTSSACASPMWAAWLGLAILRVLLTLIIVVLFLSISSVYQLTRRPSQSSTRRRQRRARRVQSDSSAFTSPPMSFVSQQPVSIASPPQRHSSRSSVASQSNNKPSLRSRESSSHNRNSRDSSTTTHNRNSSSSEGEVEETPSEARFDPAAIQQRLSEAISPSTAPYAQSDRDLNNFVDRFRSLVSQIQRETEEALQYAIPDPEDGEDYPPEGVDRYTAYPTRHRDTPTSSSFPQSNNPYVQYLQLDSNVASSSTSSSPASTFSRAGYGSYVSYNEFGLPYPPDDQIRILNGYVKRMPTIESLGSREVGEFGSWSNRSMSISSHERLGSVGTLSRPPTRTAMLGLETQSLGSFGAMESPSTEYGSVYSYGGAGLGSDRFGGSASERGLGSEPPSRANSLGASSLGGSTASLKGKGKAIFTGTETVVDVTDSEELVEVAEKAREARDGWEAGSVTGQSTTTGSPVSSKSMTSKLSYYTAGNASVQSVMLTPTSEMLPGTP
ncbi:hypothetical protein VKT23_014333 [Stygiomarasmius scandens]|uniref:Uncharacterized protein n=1 Tax=Marasmiellus scandens TaxID=2682957 RepID=A0ABR1J5U2_9AGAR